MEQPYDGGPAFPLLADLSQNQASGEITIHQTSAPGMSLRAYFAAAALPPVMQLCASDTYDETIEDHFAKKSCTVADALLRALAEPLPEPPRPAPAFPVFYAWAASAEQKDALRTLHTRTWFDQLPADLRTYVTDAMNAIASAEAGEDDIPF